MSKTIKFKLYELEAKLALAFQHHCHQNLGMSDDLNMLAKKILLKFLNDAVDRTQPVTSSPSEGAHATGLNTGDTGTVAVESQGAIAPALADTPLVSDPIAPA